MKLRWPYVAVACAFLALTAYLLLVPFRNIPSSAARALASGMPKHAATGTNACTHMYRSICQKRGDTHDPTGLVKPDVDGELQALREYERIIHEHPDWDSDRVDQELVATIYTEKRRERLRSAYQWVQSALEVFVNRQPEEVFTASEKRKLLARLRKTELQLPPPVSIYADEPDLFTKNDVVYERTNGGVMRMRVGGAYVLTAKSWFNLVFTMAHELGHAIDPCELRAARVSIPAYDRLSACFMAHGLVAQRNTRRECGDNDQLSETFADWIAVQISSEALYNFSTEFHGAQLADAAMNAVRDLCEQDDEVDSSAHDPSAFEVHPSPEIRIDRIFARNPMIREVLGCGPVPKDNGPYTSEYCNFEFNPNPAPPEEM